MFDNDSSNLDRPKQQVRRDITEKSTTITDHHPQKKKKKIPCEPESQQNGKLTIKDAKDLSDEELLAMAEKAKGDTEKFSDICNCDFSYTTLTNILRQRGYEKRWCKQGEEEPKIARESSTIKLKGQTREIVRHTYSLEKDTQDRVDHFLKHFACNPEIVSIIFDSFIDAVQTGKIKIEIDFDYK